MAREGYKAEITYSSKTLTRKEAIMLKDTSDAVRLDEATQSGPIIIKPAYYCELSIHNERSDNPDYNVYVVVAEDGTKYVTGSPSFYGAFVDIYDDMHDETEEEWQLKIYRKPSKNRQGKDFITCSII